MATPSKISKRSFTDFSFDEPFQPPSVCTNCCEVKKQIAEINEKLEEIILSLAEQKIIVSQLVRQRVENTNVAKCFPIKDEEALNIVNQNINSCAKDSYIKAMRSLLLPEGVLKNLRRILTDEFVVGFNVKGLSGKKALNSFTHFYGALQDIVSESGNAEILIPKAIQLQKKRFFKNKSKSNNNNNEALNKNVPAEEFVQ
ncbi:uncharacterized protein [Drosophila takahashii]|uniref:uncharacterized protein n=1 Tax=Drosophila takahashii TaxID=29030 RepID=UPI003898E068